VFKTKQRFSSSLRISRKHSLGEWRVFEFMLRA
jgi:hypothetical protein